MKLMSSNIKYMLLVQFPIGDISKRIRELLKFKNIYYLYFTQQPNLKLKLKKTAKLLLFKSLKKKNSQLRRSK